MASAAPVASAAPAASSAPVAAAPKNGLALCRPEPARGVEIPFESRSQDFRLAAAGHRALVTWLGPQSERGGGRTAHGRMFDGDTGTVDAELGLQRSEYGDVIPSGEAPFADGSGLATASCTNQAPAGKLTCQRTPLGAAPNALFTIDFGNFGPQDPGLAALARGADTMFFVPEGGAHDVALFTATATSKAARSRSFAMGDANGKHADALGAVFTDLAGDEAAVVYRFRDRIRVRRARWNETWSGPALDVSEKGMLVGAPAIARNGDALVIVYAARPDSKSVWHLVHAVVRGTEVVRTPLAIDVESTAPTLAPIPSSPECMRFAWVYGKDKFSRTAVGVLCGTDPTMQFTGPISPGDVEGGRAWLASSPDRETIAWQEFPAGKPPVLRVARLVCE